MRKELAGIPTAHGGEHVQERSRLKRYGSLFSLN